MSNRTALHEMSYDDLTRLPTEKLDKAAFGVVGDQVIRLHPDQIKVVYKDDLANAIHQMKQSGLKPKAWARKFDFSNPVEIGIRDGEHVLNDGHHRYLAAKILGRKLPAKVSLHDNPIRRIYENAKKAGLTTHPDAERMFKHLETPEQLTAMKAPSGGMVANGLYYPGGKYLPRLLKRIRDVRKNAQPVQLSAVKVDADKLGADNLVPMVKAVHDGGLIHPLLDYLEEQNHPLLPLFRRSERYKEMHGGDLMGKGQGVREGTSDDESLIHIAHPEGRIRIAAGRVPVVDKAGKRRHTPGAVFQFSPTGRKGLGDDFLAGAPMHPHELHALFEHFGVPLKPEHYNFTPQRGHVIRIGSKLTGKVDPDQLSALKAPSGGMVANGLYYPGGKYLPRLLKRIRDVRKNAQPVQLSRKKPETVMDSEHLKHFAGLAHDDIVGHYALADHLAESGNPLAPAFARAQVETPQLGFSDHNRNGTGHELGDVGAIHFGTAYGGQGGKQFPAVLIRHLGDEFGEGYWSKILPMRKSEWDAAYRHVTGKSVKYRNYSLVPYVSYPNVAEPEQFAREEEAPPASVARVLPSGTHSFKLPTLKHEELLGMEKEYGVPEKHRLSNSEGYSYDEKTGHIKSSKLEHLHKFLDAVTNKQIPKGLKGAKLFDHLVLHAVNDARSYMPLSDGGEWYGGSVKKLDEGLHDLLSREVPFDPKSKKIENHELWGRRGEQTAALRLFKNMVGFTSNNQKPVDNLGSALKILKTGIKKNPLRPFDGMEGYNVQPLHDYLEAMSKKYGPGDHHHVGMTPEQHTAWHNKYGADLKEQSKRGGGGISSPFSVVVGLQDEAGNIVGRRNIAGKAMTMDGTAELPPGKYKDVPFPALDTNGDLKPKGWSSRASTNASHIQLLQNVIKHFGGDHEKAAAWLEQSHPHKEVEKVLAAALGRDKAKVERSGLLPHEDTPGSFIFGPKQGPFVRNISGDPQHVTQDVWWTRSINRWLGKLTKNDKAPSAPQKQLYARIVRKASQELGMAPADLQAVLWYAEQHFHRLFGARNDSQDFAHAIKHALSSHGFDKESS